MTAVMGSLTWWASFWDTVSVWLAVFVFAGVAAELVSAFDIFARWPPLADESRRKRISRGGLVLLVAALALEVIAAIGSHNANESIIGILNHELGVTIVQATNLENLTKKLGLSNEALQKVVGVQSTLLGETGGELTALTKQSTNFEQIIRAQETRDATALASLKDDETKLTDARTEILADAGKASDAAAVATKAQADMTTALNDVQTMRGRLQEIITPRQIDNAHFSAIVAALKPFSKTPVDFAITRDPECADLFDRISDELIAANWDIHPWSGPGMPLNHGSRPAMGELTIRGVHIEISESDREKFTPAVLALANALSNAGIKTDAIGFQDKTPDGKPDSQAVKPGIVHIVIGAKP